MGWTASITTLDLTYATPVVACTTAGGLHHESEGEMIKEAVYDEEISPLMTQIIAICKRAGIATFCTFDITVDPEDPFYCTTCLPDGNKQFPEMIKKLEHLAYRRDALFAFTITERADP